MKELLQNKWTNELGKNILDKIKDSLENQAWLEELEKGSWINFFKNWIKNLLWITSDDKKEDDKKEDNKKMDDDKITASVQDKQERHPSKSDNMNSENNLDSFTNAHLSESIVKKARDYIANWWTFHSNSKWTITWGRGKYKHVCSTWSYNVLWQLWLPKVSNSTECDLNWKILPKMGLEYIWEVDPDNPGKSWYKPQNGDTAVWPRFNNGRKMTQHQATFINWYWVSDTIQSKMSCYGSKNEPMVKVYRYTWKVST